MEEMVLGEDYYMEDIVITGCLLYTSSSVGAFSLDILARDQDSAKRSRLKTKSSNQTMSIWEN